MTRKAESRGRVIVILMLIEKAFGEQQNGVTSIIIQHVHAYHTCTVIFISQANRLIHYVHMIQWTSSELCSAGILFPHKECSDT